jgi:FtsP/CotA-like multicopper oxidase with cupredoxin domain
LKQGILIIGIIIASLLTGFPLTTIQASYADEGDEHPFHEGDGSTSPAVASNGEKEFTLIALDADLEIAPGKVARAWTFNGTMPAPTLRVTEGDHVNVHFINETPVPHTIHFHGNHDDADDGVAPQIPAGGTYTYSFTADPAGALLFHCHGFPTSFHIRMGMYGLIIVDPKDPDVLEPAREFALVYSEFDPPTQQNFEAKYYPVNGYFDHYMHGNALQARQYELERFYVINIGTTIPYSFHLHGSIFKVYPSGLVSNQPFDAQTVEIGPGNAAIVETSWKYPGSFLFHSHGFQEEKGSMGEIEIAPSTPEDSELTESISMIEWQYNLQKQLQKPVIINYDQGSPAHVGGEILGTDTPSLLVYGVSANEYWILPTALISGSLGAAAFVVFLLRSKRS